MLKRIYIEISNICNVQCSFCPVVERDKQILNPSNFEKILIQAKPIAQEVCLHLMGEPLAHPNFEEVLKICEKYQVPIQLTTNGLLIEKKKELILSSGCVRQINFSLQSFKDNFPHKKLETYLEPIITFSHEAHIKRPEMYINYRLWNMGVESNENEEIFDYLDNAFEVKINRKVQVENIKSKRIWNKVYLHFDSRFEWPTLDREVISHQGRCHALTSHIGIHADGTVVPCCLDKEAIINLGNCLETPLSAILESERASRMRIGFSNGKLIEELCTKCQYVTRFFA